MWMPYSRILHLDIGCKLYMDAADLYVDESSGTFEAK